MSQAAEALSREEAFARIRLLRSPNIGPATYGQLLARFGGATQALAALPELAARGETGRRVRAHTYRPVAEAVVSAEAAAVRAAGARYLFHDSPDYPPLLRMAAGAPPILIARGEASIAQTAPVAMVGACNASAAAVRLARELAAGLAARGHAVVSGLARGIDTAAHAGALAMPDGAGTVGVIACGIDLAYPPENAALQERVAQEGLLLTEHPPGTEPIARLFPARNRIIAGLALGTVVVEAAPGSGSLITARLAGDFGREVMAVPGFPADPRSHGCNALIREGAMLVQGVDDVIELVTSFPGVPRTHVREEAEAFTGSAPADDMGDAMPDAAVLPGVLGLLGLAPVAVDELVRQSGAGTAEVQMALVELELAGRLTRHAGGKVSLMG